MSPSKFYDTKIINSKGNITIEVYRKTSKLPVHWSSRVPKWYKRNTVIGDLHRSTRISSDFEIEIKVIKRKLKSADYPPKFLNSIINQLLTPKSNDLFIIPSPFLKRVNH